MPLEVDKTEFHDALRNFVDAQKGKLAKALSSSSVGDVINATLDLQELSLVLATRFALYKSIPQDSSAKESWDQLVEIQKSIIDEDLSRDGEHFAVLEVPPSMSLRDREIHVPSSQEVEQAYDKKIKCHDSMKNKLNAAHEFLKSDAKRQGFSDRVVKLFFATLQGRVSLPFEVLQFVGIGRL